MSLSPDTTALLVVDMQNGFLDPAGSMARIGMPHAHLLPAIAGCERLIDGARDARVPVIFTRYVYLPDYSDGGLLPTELVPQMREVGALVRGTWDAEIIPALAPRVGEVVIDKARPSSFYGTQLEPVLTSQGIRQLVIAGVTTNICVETTARDAGQRDYRVHVPADACAEYDQARHDHALNTIGFTFGWVTSVESVLTHWS
ncbi:cysteine hydrolase family protein [Nocardioides sp. zg-DK7169]|uniref:cysteine hydrolase family protein n=1 Tax=Nocardioides sp. zg-DK7169 TaxID=2736600 RepID=UPI0015549292|nr:isochorismatase family cysteine hydrolase [Nocardioides sp. zg-DK7169]NPC98518.1 cysteine hydrolase [Nocardioides sp. zg-DK7169]